MKAIKSGDLVRFLGISDSIWARNEHNYAMIWNDVKGWLLSENFQMDKIYTVKTADGRNLVIENSENGYILPVIFFTLIEGDIISDMMLELKILELQNE